MTVSVQPNGGECASGEALFEFVLPDGTKQCVWADGRLEGFPDGTAVLNRALALMQYAQGLLREPVRVGLISSEEASAFLSRGGLTLRRPPLDGES